MASPRITLSAAFGMAKGGISQLALFYSGFLLRSTTISPWDVGADLVAPCAGRTISVFHPVRVARGEGLAVKGEMIMGSRRRGSGRRKVGRKKRRMRAKIRHRK